MIRVNFHLTEAQQEGLRALSEATGLGVAEHIRRAVDEYLKREKQKHKARPASASR